MQIRNGFALLLALLVLGEAPVSAARKDKKQKRQAADPYAEFVWPPPPATARIKLDTVIRGRADVEPRSGFARKLLGASPQSPYDLLVKPFAVAFDNEGRVLVTDSGTSALIRFDVEDRRMDVLGTRGNVRLSLPLGVHVASDGTIYVADAGLGAVVAFDGEGKVLNVIGNGELTNPTAAVVSPDGSKLYVADSKAHQVVIFDLASGGKLSTLGRPGDKEGEFGFPTALAFGPDGALYVVDQINSRVQLFDEDGEYLDQLGGLGVGFGNFVRPKGVAVDDVGFIYVTDNAFNNVQLFDTDFTLLTFVGAGGTGAGQFHGASGVAVSGQRFAVVDQLGRRVQLFHFIVPKDQGPGPEGAPAAPDTPLKPSRKKALDRTAVETKARRPEPAAEQLVPSPRTPPPMPLSPVEEPEAASAEVESAAPAPKPPVESSPRVEPEAVPAKVERAAPKPKPQQPPSPTAERDAVPTAVQQAVEIGGWVRDWAVAWSAQDVDRYFEFYDEEFQPEAGSRQAWVEQRRERVAGPVFIDVIVTALKADILDSGRARVTFEQEYTSNTHRDRALKVLDLRRRGNEWKITRERTSELPE